MTFLDPVFDFLSSYGWFVVFGTAAAVYVYKNYISPQIQQKRIADDLVRRKKFDESVDARVAERLAAAREKQQREHEAVSAELKRKEEEAREKKLEEMRKELESHSVLENALRLGSNSSKASKSPPKKKESPAEIIDRLIASKPVVMFSKSWCPFCRKAKTALGTFRLNSSKYEYIELDERTDLPGDEIQAEFEKRYGSKSVPKVFINGQCVGGGDDTVRLLQEGVLEQLIMTAI